MNGEVCCILQVCCPPEERAAALAKEMKKDGIGNKDEMLTEVEADKARQEFANYVFKNFDLAPAGTLAPLVKSIADVAVKAHEHKKANP